MTSRVLLASNDQHLLQAARQALGAKHIQTVIADDGHAALCLLNETLPDLLIAAIALPGKDGYSLCQYIRQEPEFESLPVVLLDSRFDAINRESALKLGADVYLSQPFAVSELVTVVGHLLESRQGGREEGNDEAATAVQTVTAYALPDDSGFRDDEGLAAAQAAAQAPLAVAALERTYVEPRLPSPPLAALPRRRPQDAWMFFIMMVVAMLIGIAIGMLLRTQPADVQTRATQPAGEQPSPDYALARAGEPYVSPVVDRGSETDGSLGVAPPASGTVAKPPARDADTQPVQAAPPAASKSLGQPPTAGADQPQSLAATAPARQSSPPARPMHRPPDTPAPPRRTVRSNTLGYHWRRSGQEAVLAGEHFGSSAKHFGKGSAKTVSWTGKKAGGGIKRIGRALKGIF